VTKNKEFQLDKTLIIPTKTSPHKSSETPFKHRFKMAEIAFGYQNFFEVSDIENRMKGISYTIDTLKELKKLYNNAEFYLIIGSDMLMSFHTWKDYKKILKKATVIAAAREKNTDEELLRGIAENLGIRYIKAPVMPISSTEIRETLSKGEYNGAPNMKIYEYIKEKGLYRAE
jgi:nicotinate-nucleotide adenylyltransferase